jgi:hypothetical protein
MMRIRIRGACLAIILFVFAGAVAGQVPASLPTSWSVANGGNGHVYQAWIFTGSWSAANAFATSVPGRYLATVTSGSENSFIFALISGIPGMYAPCVGCNPVGPWIGGTFVGGGWTWATTGEPFCYTNWAANQPANGCLGGPFENCIHFHDPSGGTSPSDRWNDLPGGGCAASGLLPVGFITELQSFDLTVSQPFAGAPITIADTGGAAGFYAFNAFSLTPDACLNGWFFGLSLSFGELSAELAGFPNGAPFAALLNGSGAYSVTFPIAPGLSFNYVGLLITPPPYVILSTSRPKSYTTI